MNYFKQNHLSILIIAFLVISSAVSHFSGKTVEAPAPAAGAIDKTVATNPWRFDAGVTRSSTNSTSTVSTAQTLVLADFLNYDTIILTPNKAAVTLTIPASSTIPTFLPVAGDMQETCILNATTTSGVNITLAGGTGIDLDGIATSTATSLVVPIGPGNVGCVKFIRNAVTASSFDITAFLLTSSNGD